MENKMPSEYKKKKITKFPLTQTHTIHIVRIKKLKLKHCKETYNKDTGGRCIVLFMAISE